MKKLTPGDIEQESFRIIESEAGPHEHMSDEQWALVRRIIHATADFDIIKTIRFHPRAIAAGLQALKKGCLIYTDTNMLGAGINKKSIDHRGSKILCLVSDEQVRLESAATGETRSAIAIRRAASQLKGGIIALGNAPTALHEAISLCEQGRLE
ncbi:MAG: precorrin-8X methylmutase, partial [Pseudomonadota bacterium]